MAGFLRAWRFLTIVPIGSERGVTLEQMATSMNFHSMVGAVLGVILVVICMGTDALKLGSVGNVIVVSALIILSGGLHLDGLADSADGLFCGGSREKKLDIMRDSRIGTMGVLAVWIVLSLKVALLGKFVGPDKIRILIFMPAVGRGALVLSAVNFPYARKEGGKGRFVQGAGKTPLLINWSFLFVLALLLFGLPGLLLLGILAGIVLLISLEITRVLGGLTGDTYGAVCEVSEMFTLLLGALLKLN